MGTGVLALCPPSLAFMLSFRLVYGPALEGNVSLALRSLGVLWCYLLPVLYIRVLSSRKVFRECCTLESCRRVTLLGTAQNSARPCALVLIQEIAGHA